MESEITIENIRETINNLKENMPIKILEDDYAILEISPLGIEKITLKPIALEMINNFIGYYKNALDNFEVVKFLGINILRSKDVMDR
jgi:hypothetical protein